MERYTRYCRVAFLEIRENEWREVLLALVGYFLSLISPHVSNKYGVREVFNVLTGLFVLAGMFNPRNLVLVLGAPLVSLVLLRVLRRYVLRNKRVNLKKRLDGRTLDLKESGSMQTVPQKSDADGSCNDRCNTGSCGDKDTDDVYTEKTRHIQRIHAADSESKEELQIINSMQSHVLSERAEMLEHRKQLGRAAVWTGLFYLLLAYCFFDAEDNCPFPAILAMLVKCFYISTAAPSGKNGLFQYASYLLFLPGIRYGPVMTYAEYSEWLQQGYAYALKKLGASERLALESEKDAKARGELQEFFIFAQYYRMFGLSMARFFFGIAYIVTYNAFIRKLSDCARSVRFALAVPMVEVLALAEKYRVVAQWAVEEAVYLATFIPNMENVDLKGIEMSTDLGGICSAWNLKGIQHAHAVMDAFGGLRNGSEHSQLEYIWISLISYGHVFLFGKSPLGMVLGTVSALIMPLVPDTVLLRPVKQGSGRAEALAGLCRWMISRFFFSYFLIGSLCDAQVVASLWRKTLGVGHLVPLIAQNIIPLGK